ncbi:Mpv17/PMP22 family protein [Chloropicon primus]|uniref:Mpv17/PMP22 family protein n=1 Tax=Chloropicon primus TaxID=1764295 RepID=A0A5B8MH76_9CHLO|nr:Mpv17/PMP22 family protein [Chloropicon primus]|eukprot:QDZ19434.1 Mpv17/PMP22 family protein [Chloropicon primus]
MTTWVKSACRNADRVVKQQGVVLGRRVTALAAQGPAPRGVATGLPRGLTGRGPSQSSRGRRKRGERRRRKRGERGGRKRGGGEPLGLLAWYLALVDKHPIPMKLATTAFLNFAGDLICQLTLEDGPFNYRRSATFTFLGLALVAPALHFWYLNLSKFVTTLGLTSNKAALVSVLCDQLVFSPVFIGTFLSCLTCLEGKPAEIIPRLKAGWLDSLVLNWKIWVPFQLVNFRFVPQNYQVLFANLVALIWNTGLSFIANKSKKEEGGDKKGVKGKAK